MAQARPTPEPFASRWRRRAVSIPAMLAVTAAGIVGLPLLVVAAAGWDVVHGKLRLPTLRVYLFLLQYVVNDSVEIVLAPVLWLAAGGGRWLRSDRSIRRHERLARWSIEVLARRAERLLGLRFELVAGTEAALGAAPAIVLCRHVNLVDASLPTLLYQRRGVRTRGVIMAELLADPGFDLLYGRLGSVFIPRDDAPSARAAIAELCSEFDDRTIAVIFPEGRLFRPVLLERGLTRLAERDPRRAERLAGLHHVLVPRSGGFEALLDGLPAADVVVIAHVGLDRFAGFGELAAAVPLPDPVRVVAWRTARADIPDDHDGRVRWLDDTWCRVDAWVAEADGDQPRPRG